MPSASSVLRSLLSFILFLALTRIVVLADDEDYDPCKAGKFESQFPLQFHVARLFLFVNEPIFLRFNRNLRQFVRARELTYQLCCQINNLN